MFLTENGFIRLLLIPKALSPTILYGIGTSSQVKTSFQRYWINCSDFPGLPSVLNHCRYLHRYWNHQSRHQSRETCSLHLRGPWGQWKRSPCSFCTMSQYSKDMWPLHVCHPEQHCSVEFAIFSQTAQQWWSTLQLKKDTRWTQQQIRLWWHCRLH